MATLTWTGGAGNYFASSNWSPEEKPHPGDTLDISSSGAEVEVGRFALLADVTIDLAGAYGDPARLDIGPFSAIGPGTTIETTGLFGPAHSPSQTESAIATAGLVANLGTIEASSQGEFSAVGNTDLQIGPNQGQGHAPFGQGVFLNLGELKATGFGALRVSGTAPGATLVNDGRIDIGGEVGISVPVLGQGRMTFEKPALYRFGALPGSALDINAPVGAGQTIDFAGVGNRLGLHDPSTFQGLIAGFVTEQPYAAFGTLAGHITLFGVDFSGFSYQGDAQGGTLTVAQAAGPAVSLRFAGDYLASAGSFTLTHNQAGTPVSTEIGFTPAA